MKIRPVASSAKGSVMSPDTKPRESNDSIRSPTIRSIPFWVAAQMIPQRSRTGRDALLAKARFFANGDGLITTLPDYPAIVGSDQKSPALLMSNALTGSWLVSPDEPDPERGKVQAVETRDAFGRSDQQKPALALDDSADITLGQAVFHVPLLLLVFGK